MIMFPPLTLRIAGPSKTYACRCYLSDVFHADRVLLLVHMGFEVTGNARILVILIDFVHMAPSRTTGTMKSFVYGPMADLCRTKSRRHGKTRLHQSRNRDWRFLMSWCQATCWGVGRWRWKETCYYRYLARLGWNHFKLTIGQDLQCP